MFFRFCSIALLSISLLAGLAGAQPSQTVLPTDSIAPIVANCSSFATCAHCANHPACFWCAGVCTDDTRTAVCNVTSFSSLEKDVGWCSGAACDCRNCLNRIFPCTNSIGAAVFLLATYLFLIALGSYSVALASLWITERSGPFSKYFSSIISPLLSTAPLLGVLIAPTLVNDDNELSSAMETAMGALSGSTTYILTVLWSLSVYRARCDFDGKGHAINGVAGRLTWASLTQSGVTLDRNAIMSARIMVVTMLSYFIIQGPSFQYVQQPLSAVARLSEKNFALATIIICAVLLVLYFLSSLFFVDLFSLRFSLAKELADDKMLSRRILFFIRKFRIYEDQLAAVPDQDAARTIENLRDPVQAAAGMIGALANENRRVAAQAPADQAVHIAPRGPLAPIEIEPPRPRMRPRHLQLDDAPHEKPPLEEHNLDRGRIRFEDEGNAQDDIEQEEDIERQDSPRDEEAPPKRKHAEKVVQPIDAPSLGVERMRRHLLSPDAKVFISNRVVFWTRALLLLGFGVLFSVVFSEAAVTASADLSRKTSSHPFYFSFIFFPIAINISELLIAFGVAGRRRRSFTTFTFANLYNSATLNNLIGLGVFCLIVYTRDLAWTFSAETISTLIVSCAVGLLASLVRTIPLWVAGPVGFLYLVSVVVFRFLEHYAKWT